MSEPLKLLDDKREVESICKDEWIIKVGEDGVTKIVIYAEPGNGAYVPWAALYQGDSIRTRVDLNGCGVTYTAGGGSSFPPDRFSLIEFYILFDRFLTYKDFESLEIHRESKGALFNWVRKLIVHYERVCAELDRIKNAR